MKSRKCKKQEEKWKQKMVGRRKKMMNAWIIDVFRKNKFWPLFNKLLSMF